MARGSKETSVEIIQQIESAITAEDRISIISVANTIQLEKGFDESQFIQFSENLDTNGSLLSTGLEQALDMIETNKSGAILLISDGANTESSWSKVQRTALSRNIPIHVVPKQESKSNDIQITNIQHPYQITEGEGLPIEVDFYSPFDGTVQIELRKDERVVAKGQKSVEIGYNKSTFETRQKMAVSISIRCQFNIQTIN